MSEPRQTRVLCLHAQDDLRLETRPLGDPGPAEVRVAVLAGGICGSDMHYWHTGGIGTIRLREAMILGHEAAGRIEALGHGVAGLEVGQIVALNPSNPCGDCGFCHAGMVRHCTAMKFRGSAMYLPHEQGLFRDRVVIGAKQCLAVPPGIAPGVAACAEPLAVCLHAASRAGAVAGSLRGRTVMVTGAGPIGALCVAAARHCGAGHVIATDIQDATLAVARQMGANETVNTRADPDGLALWRAEKGQVDLVFECSAAASAIRDAVDCLRPLGTLVQVGVAGPTPMPLNVMVGKEIQCIGSHRFDVEFADAVGLIGSGAIDPAPIITGTFPLERAIEAFHAAGDRSRSVKVQLSFAES